MVARGRESAPPVVTDGYENLGAAWRGVTGLWGNMFQLVDGMRIAPDRSIQIWDNRGQRTWITTPAKIGAQLIQVTFSSARGDGYDLSTTFLPDTLSSNASDGSTGDQIYTSAGESNRVAMHGGSIGYTTSAGLFCLYLQGTEDQVFGATGFRLAKV